MDVVQYLINDFLRSLCAKRQDKWRVRAIHERADVNLLRELHEGMDRVFDKVDHFEEIAPFCPFNARWAIQNESKVNITVCWNNNVD